MFDPIRSKIGKALLGLALLLAATHAVAAHDYQFIKSDGVDIAYTEYGASSGVPVIFLHGFQGSFEPSLLPAADLLGKDFRVIGMDQRGHGRSGKPHDADAYGKHMADDVLNLMDALKIPKAHLIGHSMGGAVAMYLAANHPQRFYSVVTIGNGLFARWELNMIGWLLSGKMAWTGFQESLGLAEAPVHPDQDMTALPFLVRSLSDLTVTPEQAATIKLPVLAMRGGPKDDPRDTVERLVQINPSVKMIRIETEDHGSMLSCAACLQGLQAFILARPQ